MAKKLIEDEEDDLNVDSLEDEGGEEVTKKEKKSDDSESKLLKASLAAQEERNRKLQEALLTVAIKQNDGPREDEEEEEEEDDELDFLDSEEGKIKDKKKFKKFLDSKVSRGIERSAEAYKQQWQQDQNRALSNQNRVLAKTLRKEWEQEMRDIDREDLIEKVDKYIKDNGVTTEQLVLIDDAYNVLAKTILGEEALEEKRAKRNAGIVSSSRGRSYSIGDEGESSFTNDDVKRVERDYNVKVIGGRKELEALSKKEVSIEEWRAIRQEAELKNRRRSAS